MTIEGPHIGHGPGSIADDCPRCLAEHPEEVQQLAAMAAAHREAQAPATMADIRRLEGRIETLVRKVDILIGTRG